MIAHPRMLRIFHFSAIYFGMVFAAGFVLGPIRVLVLEPRVGTRWAELLEMPVMIAAILVIARGLVRRHSPPWTRSAYLAAGVSGMLMVIIADIGVGIGLREMTASEVFTQRDPISGTAYYLALLIFGLAPQWFGGRKGKPK